MKLAILKSAFFKPKKPVHLVLHVTNRCNYRCQHCFVDFSHKVTDITLEEIKGIAAYLDKLIWLDIGGGEPFLRKDLPEICSSFNAKAISIPTNGAFPSAVVDITREIRKKTKAELTICVSIDGFEESNDYIRSKGSYLKAIETLKLLKEVEGIRVKVNTVLCGKNYNELIDFMKFIKGFDPDFHSIIIRRGDPVPPDFEHPTHEQLVKIKEDIFRIWQSYEIKKGFQSKILDNYKRLVYQAGLDVIEHERQIPDCLAGTHHLVVYANGDVSTCETLKPYGNLRKTKLEPLLKSEIAAQMRKLIEDKVCYCYHNCNLVENYFLNPRNYPKLLAGVLGGKSQRGYSSV